MPGWGTSGWEPSMPEVLAVSAAAATARLAVDWPAAVFCAANVDSPGSVVLVLWACSAGAQHLQVSCWWCITSIT